MTPDQTDLIQQVLKPDEIKLQCAACLHTAIGHMQKSDQGVISAETLMEIERALVFGRACQPRGMTQ